MSKHHAEGQARAAKNSSHKKFVDLILAAITVLGAIVTVLSLFPHLTVSEPVQMDASDLFSYKMTVTNDGLLPVFNVKWGLAPRRLSVRNQTAPVAPAPKNDAFVFMHPNTTSFGPDDFAFELRGAETMSIGTLTPGDGSTITTEHFVAAPPGSLYGDDVDFAIAIHYIPVFPPIPMETCSHFHLYQDRHGNQHWFRAPDRCNHLPWLHHWFGGK